MDVREFVAQTLEQIVQGVVDAQKLLAESQAGVNPPRESVAVTGARDLHTGQPLQDVTFDLAVTASSSTGTEARLSVSVWPVTAGAGGSSSGVNNTTSRVSFKVPLSLPRHVGRTLSKEQKDVL